MARKKLSVNDIVSNHYFFILQYFERAIRNQKILTYSDVAYDAKDEFKKLPLSANKNEDLLPFVGWIEKYIDPDIWRRCKTAIRQHTFMETKKKKYEYKTFRIPRDLSNDIEHYAKRINLPKFAAMKKAIELATNLLNANENKKRRK